jgi:hypothetical protein
MLLRKNSGAVVLVLLCFSTYDCSCLLVHDDMVVVVGGGLVVSYAPVVASSFDVASYR